MTSRSCAAQGYPGLPSKPSSHKPTRRQKCRWSSELHHRLLCKECSVHPVPDASLASTRRMRCCLDPCLRCKCLGHHRGTCPPASTCNGPRDAPRASCSREQLAEQGSRMRVMLRSQTRHPPWSSTCKPCHMGKARTCWRSAVCRCRWGRRNLPRR